DLVRESCWVNATRNFGEGKAFGVHKSEAGQHFRGEQAQIERHEDDADFETGVLEENMLAEKRQERGEALALAETALQQAKGEAGRHAIEGGPGHFLFAIRVNEGDGGGLLPCPLLHDAMKEVTISKALLEVVWREAGKVIGNVHVSRS